MIASSNIFNTKKNSFAVIRYRVCDLNISNILACSFHFLYLLILLSLFFNRILYVSTLDGKITALEILNGGNKKWSVSTTPGHMISSSIHNLELTNNGQWVRMIPSLTGALYKFDGETVEPIPINADNLLSSSFKFSDDLVISGKKRFFFQSATY